MLSFSQTENKLIVSGKTFYVRDIIRALGGKWNSANSAWCLPIFLDGEEFRQNLQNDADSAYKAIKQKEREERKAQRAYEKSPEGKAAAAEAEKKRIQWCYEQKQKTGAFNWICCADCRVVDWDRKHTVCMRCAEWDGQTWNSFRVRGGIYTGT